MVINCSSVIMPLSANHKSLSCLSCGIVFLSIFLFGRTEELPYKAAWRALPTEGATAVIPVSGACVPKLTSVLLSPATVRSFPPLMFMLPSVPTTSRLFTLPLSSRTMFEKATGLSADGKTPEELDQMIRDNSIPCPKCGKHNFTNARPFNLMFKTSIGTLEDAKSTVYLRPETAQGIFLNFNNVQRTSRKKIPFGIGQIGKAFRNEITPGNFIFRMREFEQMELEFFCKPGTDLEWYKYWIDECQKFIKHLGVKPENLRVREHEKKELAFYSKGTSDIEYAFPFTEWGEVWGIADRTDFDLKRQSEYSGKALDYLDPETNERYVPYCVEPSVGVDRLFLMFVCDAYDKEKLEGDDERIVMHLHPALAPVKASILPLSKKLSDKATQLFNDLNNEFHCEFDEAGSIGKRYRRNDAIGTPFCITYDFDTENDSCVTIRERDSMKQERIKIEDLKDYIKERIKY